MKPSAWLLFAGLFPLCFPCVAEEPFRFQADDLVVFLGDTFLEREHRDGHIEEALLLSAAHPVRFRNLGWSGDTVAAEARGYFGGAKEGFERLTSLLSELRPTCIFLCYGGSAAFDGPAGLESFRTGYATLLDRVSSTAAPREIVLLSPPPAENLGAPFPDLDGHNGNLALYRDAIRDLATSRGHRFLDLFEALGGWSPPVPKLTDNGIHYTPEGYARIAREVTDALGLPRVEPRPEHADRLRNTIVAKNRLYFHRWRPANETYLHLFRKHEQGNNAAELPLFEPLVQAKEQEIEVFRQVALPKSIVP